MFRTLGRLIWRQSREMYVLNYPNHVVFEVYTNKGYLYFIQDKTTDAIEVINDNKKNIIVDEAVPCLR